MLRLFSTFVFYHKPTTGLVGQMTATVFHQSCVTQ